jgi:predicted RNA binding protein YcfA (HicA-like mRNA interferase family)
MPKLPVISGDKAVKFFEKIGYEVSRQKGSHMRLRHKFDQKKKPLTIPKHKELGTGLLRKILRDAEITLESFIEELK